MFRALHRETQEPLISLDGRWKDELELLRSLDRDDKLICPECGANVRIRAGQHKRWHFAHKNASDCPLNDSEPQRLEIRALLYNWLASKRPRVTLGIEERISLGQRKLVIDCTVELANQERIAYFVLASGIRERAALIEAISNNHAHCHWVFHPRTLHPSADGKGLLLSTTQRAVIELALGPRIPVIAGKSLHSLDAATRSFTTYRRLQCVHAPQEYQGTKLVNRLDDIKVGPRTGEFVHPVEVVNFTDTSVRRKEARAARKQPPRPKTQTRKPPETFCEKCGTLSSTWARRTRPGWCVCHLCA